MAPNRRGARKKEIKDKNQRRFSNEAGIHKYSGPASKTVFPPTSEKGFAGARDQVEGLVGEKDLILGQVRSFFRAYYKPFDTLI